MNTKALPRLTGLLLGLLLAGIVPRARGDDGASFARRWFYASHNLLVDKNADDLIALVDRAGKAGYNGVVLADYKFNILDRMPERYFKNVARVKAAADAASVEIIPTVFPVGYSSGLLAHDPNLAEGLPVKDAPFAVQNGKATLDKSESAKFKNGDLEEASGDRFGGFAFQDDIGKTTFADREVVHGGQTSCRMQDIARHNAAGNCRLAQRVKLRPFACYRFSAWVKTKDLQPTGGFRLLALGASPAGRTLTFYEGHLESTGDWQRVSVVFNSLDEREATLYAGQWGGRSGTLWLDDVRLVELSLVNVLRREGCPLVVASADEKTTYTEGRDFRPIVDAKLGQTPYAGEYSFDHDGPSIELTADSRIRDGDRLRVSWYHPAIVHENQVVCCLTEKKVYDLLEDQGRRVNDLFKPRTFFMSHDEFRVGGWCKTCQASGKTPGALLADNVRQCAKILQHIAPQSKVAVWSDMFDPYHNAVDKYYLVNGSLKELWQGLPKDVIIANWNSGKAKESLKWFADRGHAQVIAGYYDGDDLTNFARWTAAAKGVPRVDGFMYTTWEHKYGLLEAYGKKLSGK